MRTYKDAKAMAKSLRDSLATRSVSLSHSECLEIVAQQFGFADWNTLAAKLDVESEQLAGPDHSESAWQPPIPAVSVTSIEQAAPFYADFLGFAFDWGFGDGSTYAQISRSGATIHLDANPRSRAVALIRMRGIHALHRELSGKSESFSPTEVSFTPWDSRVFAVTDPFGNVLRFWENNPQGVAQPLRRQGR
jgi:hypothetical protein